MNKKTSQTSIRFDYKELRSFKKVYGDFESITTKDSYHIIKDLEVQLTFQQTQSDNCTLSDILLMKNEPFVEKLSDCVVRVTYMLLLELLNE